MHPLRWQQGRTRHTPGALFYLRGAAPPEISTGQIYRGVMPFIVLQAVGVLILWLIPQLATTLPDLLF